MKAAGKKPCRRLGRDRQAATADRCRVALPDFRCAFCGAAVQAEPMNPDIMDFGRVVRCLGCDRRGPAAYTAPGAVVLAMREHLLVAVQPVNPLAIPDLPEEIL